MMNITRNIAKLLCCLPSTLYAGAVDLPATAQAVFQGQTDNSSYALPVGPANGQTVPTRLFEGTLSKQSYRIDGRGVTTLQLLKPIRDQLIKGGYSVVFECRDRDCGGFDFRFGIDTLSAPDMFVDLLNYRFLSAMKPDRVNPTSGFSVLISQSAGASYIQLYQIGDADGVVVTTNAEPIKVTQSQMPEVGVVDGLGAIGHVVLGDLQFKTGSATLEDTAYQSLIDLAKYLDANPQARIAVVGHTDTIGGLEANIALSKKRAASVRDRLIDRYGIDADRIDAEGNGYLSPITTNATAEGRAQNRRVEAVLLVRE